MIERTRCIELDQALDLLPTQIREALKELSSIEVRTVFGEQGVFCREIMFLWIRENKCYLRACNHLQALAYQLKITPFSRMRADGQLIVFRYYNVTDLLKYREFDPVFYLLSSIKSAQNERALCFRLRKTKVLRAAQHCLKVPKMFLSRQSNVRI